MPVMYICKMAREKPMLLACMPQAELFCGTGLMADGTDFEITIRHHRINILQQ